ncbi:MAG TPA: hypothetical protein VHE12_09380 [bacterium]|nr:hypothetical protein [bacterium]
MKSLRILSLFLVLFGIKAFAFAESNSSPASAPDAPKATPTPNPWKYCNGWFETKYDKFKDQTTFQPKSLRSAHNFKVKGGDEVAPWIKITFPGQKYDPKSKATISLVLFRLDVTKDKDNYKAQHTGSNNYQECSNLILLVDDVKMDLGTLKYDVKSSFDGFTGLTYLDQTWTTTLTMGQLKALAGAKKIEGEFCETNIEFQKDNFCVMNAALDFLNQ